MLQQYRSGFGKYFADKLSVCFAIFCCKRTHSAYVWEVLNFVERALPAIEKGYLWESSRKSPEESRHSIFY